MPRQCAPRLAASATRSSALAILSAGSGPHDICTSATLNFSGKLLSAANADAAGRVSTHDSHIDDSSRSRIPKECLAPSWYATSLWEISTLFLVHWFFDKTLYHSIWRLELSAVMKRIRSQTRNHSEAAGHKGTGNEGAGIDRKLHDPVADRLIPLAPLDLAEVHSIDDLRSAHMSR